MAIEQLTPEELEELQGYISAMEALAATEPEYSPFDARSADAWEAWNKKGIDLTDKHRDVIRKALVFSLGSLEDEHPQSVAAILSAFYTDGQQPQPYAGEQFSLFPEDQKEQALQSEIINALPRLKSVLPQKHLIPNNKLANSITSDIIDAGAYDLIVSAQGKPEITTRCILSYEGENVKLSSRQPVTEYDRQVNDAVTSLYVYGDNSHIVTGATVYRAMVHATGTETPSPQQIGAVTRSLDKMRFVRVQIDCSDELTKRNISLNGEQITRGKIDTYLLALEKLEVMAGGQKVTAYKVMKPPILYDYARLTKQVLTVPAALLDIRDETGGRVANTERRIAIKGYLMRRIERMKGKTGARQSRHILYTDVYSSVCDTDPKEKEQRLIREYIALVLDSWTRDKYIAGYGDIARGRRKTGIEIIL